MSQKLQKVILNALIGVLCLSTITISPTAIAAPMDTVKTILSQFRSSDLIDYEDIKTLAFSRISPSTLGHLANMGTQTLIATMKSCGPECAINQNVARNILRMQEVAKVCRSLCFREDMEGYLNNVWNSSGLDKFVQVFPKVGQIPASPNDFNYREYKLKKLAKADPLSNDFYNFSQAAVYFSLGWHKTRLSTFRLFSRGSEKRRYMIVMGTEQALDMLQQLSFSAGEVDVLRQNPKMRKVPEAFFKYLETFRFNGSVRMLKPGSLAFKNETIMEITGNPVEVSLVETLVTPIVNQMMGYMTEAVRVKEEADGRGLLEGGTRRGANGILSALSALYAGFNGTSNLRAAWILGQFGGGTQAHQFIGHFGDEVIAHASYKNMFPEATNLPDTYSIEEGLKRAIRGSGRNFTGVRLDSSIPGLGSNEDEAKQLTVARSHEVLNSVGQDRNSYSITLSDGLTPASLGKLKGSDFNSALVGTAIAAPDPGHLNTVYKYVEGAVRIYDQAYRVSYPIKKADGKLLWPGQTDLYRTRDERGKVNGGLLAARGEEVNGLGPSKIFEAMKDGVRLSASEKPEVVTARTLEEVSSLAPALRSTAPIDKSNPMTVAKFMVSPKLQSIQDRAAHDTDVTSEHKKFGVFFGSFDPMHEEHANLIKRVKALYGFDEILVVPTGQKRIHKQNEATFTDQQCKNIIERFFPVADFAKHRVKVWTGEIEGRTQFSYDTLKDIEKSYSEASKDIWIVAGEDVFTTLPTWDHAEELAKSYNWVVPYRQGADSDHLRGLAYDPLFNNHNKISDSVWVTPAGLRVEMVNIGLKKQSSTELRNRINNVTAIFHEVDSQLTFWEGMHGTAPGPLAVGGTAAISENVRRIKLLAALSENIKVVASSDSHYQVEVNSRDVNPEFHPNDAIGFPGFPPHAMEGLEGPVGRGRVPEVLAFQSKDILEIPHQVPEGEKLKLVPYDLSAQADVILDPSKEVLILKNGQEAHDVWSNPRTKDVFKMIQSVGVINKPIYIYGVATDFCVKASVLGALKEGYEVIVIEDAIAGVFPNTTADALAAYKAAGAKFIKTADLLKQFNAEELFKKAKIQAPAHVCLNALEAI